MIKRSIQSDLSDNNWRQWGFQGKQFAGKTSENVATVGKAKCGCEARNTYTWGAEAGEVKE